ncbi:hypothetical protein BH24CHL9_BH24CHL9_13320 [soil metagenome]
MRKQAQLRLDARITLWLDAPDAVLEGLQPWLASVAADTLADEVHRFRAPDGIAVSRLDLASGSIGVARANRDGKGA